MLAVDGELGRGVLLHSARVLLDVRRVRWQRGRGSEACALARSGRLGLDKPYDFLYLLGALSGRGSVGQRRVGDARSAE